MGGGRLSGPWCAPIVSAVSQSEAWMIKAQGAFLLLCATLRLGTYCVVGLLLIGVTPWSFVTASMTLTFIVVAWLWSGLSSASPLPDVLPSAGWWDALCAEALLGSLLALALSAPLLGTRWAGAVIDRLYSGEAADAGGHPRGWEQPWERFFSLLALALFAALGGLRVAARVLFGSLVEYPLGGLELPTAAAAFEWLQILSRALRWALRLAAPVLLAYVCATWATVLLARLTSPRVVAWFQQRSLQWLGVWLLVMFSLASWSEGLAHELDLSLDALRQLLRAF